MAYGLKKDIEQLSEILQRIAKSDAGNTEARVCLDRAYAGVSQAILSLEKLELILLDIPVEKVNLE